MSNLKLSARFGIYSMYLPSASWRLDPIWTWWTANSNGARELIQKHTRVVQDGAPNLDLRSTAFNSHSERPKDNQTPIAKLQSSTKCSLRLPANRQQAKGLIQDGAWMAEVLTFVAECVQATISFRRPEPAPYQGFVVNSHYYYHHDLRTTKRQQAN